MQIDIRTYNEKNNIDNILITDSDPNGDWNFVSQIYKSDKNIILGEPWDGCLIKNKQHVKDIIKALEKAIELGWFE